MREEFAADLYMLSSAAAHDWPPIQPVCPRWTEAWRRLKLVREAAALGMTDADVLAALCGSLLRCQQWRLASKYLGGTASTPLPASTAEAVVLGRARALLSSAAGLGSQEVSQVCDTALKAFTNCARVQGGFCGFCTRCHYHVGRAIEHSGGNGSCFRCIHGETFSAVL